MAGYTVGINSETKAFKQGIESGVIEPLEDAQKELQELGRNKGPEQLERGLKDAQRATEKLSDETQTAAREIEREFRDTYRKVKQSSDDGIDGAKKGLDELGDEAKQTAKETAASFDGSFESIIDMGQEVAANAFGGFGPAGIAAGLAAAGGIGLLVAAFDQAEERRQALEDRASSLAQAYIEAGSTVLDTITLASRVSEVLTTPEQREEAQKLADVLGVDLPEAARVLAGDTNALAGAQEVLAQKREALNKQQQDGKLLTEEEAQAYGNQSIALSNAADSLGTYATNNDKAAQAARAYSDALLGMVADAGQAGVEVDELGNKLITLPDNTQVMINAETGQATTDISRFKGDADGVIDHLNGRDIVLEAKASVAEAQRVVNNFITQNDGKSFRLNGRVTVSGGGQIP